MNDESSEAADSVSERLERKETFRNRKKSDLSNYSNGMLKNREKSNSNVRTEDGGEVAGSDVAGRSAKSSEEPDRPADESKSESSSGYSSTSSTPSPSSPPQTLKRSRSSNFRLIDRRSSVISVTSHVSNVPDSREDHLANVIGWYPAFLLRALYELSLTFVYVSIAKLPVAVPTLCFSAGLWLFLKCSQIPLTVTKTVLTFLFVSPVERYRKKRTVLLSGGSSVQTVHLARNFYSAGARVVVCELAGRFSLAKFSTAVHKYYVLPEPNDDYMDPYVNALKRIIVDEQVSYYIPVSEASCAYYDALAKPHLESLNCRCFCPDVKDVLLLDDTLEFMRKVNAYGTVTPPHYLVQSRNDLDRVYDARIPQNEDHFMVSVGPVGVRRKRKISLPTSRRLLTLANDTISEQRPWLVVRDFKRNGEHFMTCTTVKESRVEANVTCRLDGSACGLVPIEHAQIETWLNQFFANLATGGRRITGHVSFTFAVSSDSGSLVPIDCEVGIRMPYICYTSVHPRIVWKPCRHFSRSTSGPIVTDTGRYWIHEIFLKTVQKPSVEAITKLAGVLFDGKEALFVFWDPLPYCAFYYLQLPLNVVTSRLKHKLRTFFVTSSS